jgi:molecular chaperone GrpE (heat shock protein)
MTTDPFAITEGAMPVGPGVAAVDMLAAHSDALVRNGKLEDELVEVRATAVENERRLLHDLLAVVEALDGLVAAAVHDPDTGRRMAAEATSMLLRRILRRRGVERAELLGTLADTEAVDIDSSEPDPAQPDGSVLRVIVPAYRWNDRWLRRGVVVVSYRPE